MQTPITSISGDKIWANPGSAFASRCNSPAGNETQQHPAFQTFHPGAITHSSARGIVIVTSKTLCPIVGLAVPSSACNSGRRGSEPCLSADCNAWTCILVPPGPHSPPAPSPAGTISKFRVYPLMSRTAILLAEPAGFTRGVRKNQTLAPSALQ